MMERLTMSVGGWGRNTAQLPFQTSFQSRERSTADNAETNGRTCEYDSYLKVDPL